MVLGEMGDDENGCCGHTKLLYLCLWWFIQRDMGKLRDAVALLAAQQTSLEIIVNMCCSDGECGGRWGPPVTPGLSAFVWVYLCACVCVCLCLSLCVSRCVCVCMSS